VTESARETDAGERTALERQLTVTHYLRATTAAAARLTSLLDFDRVLETVTATLVEDFDAALARIWLAEPGSKTLYLRAEAGSALAPDSPGRGEIHFAALPIWLDEVVRTRNGFVLPDLTADPRFDQEWAESEGVRALAAFPLVLAEELHGVMVVFSRRPLSEELVSVLASFTAIVTASLNDVQLFVREQEARAEAEEARRRSSFLAEASAVLASSLDYETTLRSIAHLIVPELADWCIVDMREGEGGVRRIEMAHEDPERLAMAREFSQRYQEDRVASGASLQVMRTGRSRLVREITDEMLAAAAPDPEHLSIWRELDLRSYMCVALTAHGRTRGAITLISTQPGRRFGAADLVLAEELARRVAIAVDNALLYQELQEAIRIRDEFLSSVSHDLKNPIAAIKGRAQMMERRLGDLDPDDRERFARGLEAIDTAATRMARSINDLVDLARLRIGQPLELSRGPVDLVELVQGVVADQHAGLNDPCIRVETETDSLLGTWDAVRLHRVFTNLVSNAVKYSPDGGDIVVRIGQEQAGGGRLAMVSVRDEGLGIPPEDLAHVFERYHRGANVADRFDGSGVGLAAARQIVEQHGGRISVESAAGKGSTFSVELPLEPTA
jgi:signal transduction histidine kinase